MRPHRILVVDDSAVVRRLLTDALSADPSLQVAGTAPNGRLALEMLAQTKPDLVLLDVEMPEMDGLATLQALRATHRRLPVVMCSTLTARGASVTVNALALGATDYVTKPSSRPGNDPDFARRLVEKVKAICGAPAPPAPAPRRQAATPSAPVEVVVIGASTGGPNALGAVLRSLPADFPAPVLVVQHMPPMFTRYLAERLDQTCALTVREAAGGELPRPGEAWIAPGDHHLVLARDPLGRLALRTHQGARENSCRPAVDPLFRSAAETVGAGLVAVVLTGMGQDGLAGCGAVRKAGGRVLAQDADTSVVWGMPGCVARAGLADAVLPIDEVAGALLMLTRGTRAAAARALGGTP